MASEPVKVLLIGGTSHVGKSSLAAQLVEKKGWDLLSTDQLARHPGRPWRAEGEVPGHVRDYYATRAVDILLHEVTEHYRSNVWPIAAAIIRSRLANEYDHSLVFEGSALMPTQLASLASPGIKAVWLTARDDVIRQRIYRNSDYLERSEQEQYLIDQFLKRALVFNAELLEASRDHNCQVLDAAEPDSLQQLMSILSD